jgi:hypothetical protein
MSQGDRFLNLFKNLWVILITLYVVEILHLDDVSLCQHHRRFCYFWIKKLYYRLYDVMQNLRSFENYPKWY